ncbi:cathepsin like thiol protease [Cryptosporidium canis]|uniref:Cathepsin like thiol protease n=1 Tax=Cryptosporidium canis TaxID=195482 RepID=A0A9D5DFJ6_9CRYT|nr:cathepsin like thiol protease [Cryptosporidium canis]
MELRFEERNVNKENLSTMKNNGLQYPLERNLQNVSNITTGNDVTKRFFDSLEFNFSTEIYQCIIQHEELKKYFQKIALIFYFSSKVNRLENEDFNHNTTNIWQIENDQTSNATIKMNIATHSGGINNDLDIVIHPGIFINSVHKSNTTWIDRIMEISNINTMPMNVLNMTISQQGESSTTDCICKLVLEIQTNLKIKRSTLENCIKKIQEISVAIRSNPEAKFELTKFSLDHPPSRLVIPKSLGDKVIGSNWKDSLAEGKEFVYENTYGSEQRLESTYSSGNEILRQLIDENTGTGNRANELKNQIIGENFYFDARDINGSSCVYLPFDQGKCGGCYAFVVSASISISNCVQKSELPAILSPQQIIDCSTGFGNLGCDGGFYSNGWSYLLEQNIPKNYICSWDEYPYIDSSSSCRAKQCDGCLNISKYNIFTGLALNGNDGWDFVTTILPKVGSISLSINSELPGFSSYSDGIYRAPKCTVFSELNHAVIMIGFGVSKNGEKYYVIQNSWGTSWGIGGFMNVSADSCDMFWYPGIIRQTSSKSLPSHCLGNKLLLTGPGEVSKPLRVSNSRCILMKKILYGAQIIIIALLFIPPF